MPMNEAQTPRGTSRFTDAHRVIVFGVNSLIACALTRVGMG